MNRFLVKLSGLLILGLLLSACSNEEQGIQDVYDQALKASEKLKSFEMSMDVNQTIALPDMDKMDIDITATSQIQTDPMAFHQKMEMRGTQIEMYYTQDGLYIQQPGSNQWLKAPKDLLSQFSQLTQTQQNPADQLKQLQKYVDDFTMEEKDDSYVLSIASSGDKMKDFIKDQLEQNMPNGTLSESMLKGITILNVTYKITVGKDNFYPKTLDMEMDLEIDQKGEQAKITQKMKGTYSKYNEIDDIQIPEKIKNNAQEMPMSQAK